MSWTLTQSFLSSQGEVAYDVFGHGPPLVLVHGTPSWSYLWRRVIPALARDFRVHVYDLPGFGSSAKFDGQDVSIGTQTTVLGEMLDHWGLRQPLIAGHDTGAAVVLRAHLLEGREFDRIALLDALATRPRGGGRWGTPWSLHLRDYGIEPFAALPEYLHVAIMRTYIRSAMAQPIDDLALQPYIDPWLGTSGQTAFYRQIAQLDVRYTDEIEPILHKTRAPVRLIWGQEDTWLDPDMALKAQAALPDSELCFVAGAGHFVQEDAPWAVTLELSRFYEADRQLEPGPR